ncbi:hypothetical protein BH23GEM2_BH23GEM2_22280 [soil metagenome]
MVVQSWVANAGAWTRAVREGRIASRRQGTDAAILEAVLASGPAAVLDVGCGEGWLARALSESGIDVAGIDSSPPLIEKARELGGGHFEVLAYDELVASQDTLRGPFDAIVCNFSLFTDDLAPVLTALAARLSATGTLFIQTANPGPAAADQVEADGWRTEDFSSFDVEFPAPMPWYFRTLASWDEELARAGLRIAERRVPANPATGQPLSLLLACRHGAG